VFQQWLDLVVRPPEICTMKLFASRLAAVPAALPAALALLASLAHPAAHALSSYDPAQDKTSANYLAPTTVVASDALAAIEAVITSVNTAAAVSASQTVACSGGGTLTLNISGTPEGLLNGQPDTGEVYALVFEQCLGSRSGVINGQATLSFSYAANTADGSTTTQSAVGTLSLSQLSVSSPVARQGQRLGVTLNGLVNFNRSQADSASNTVVNGRYSGQDVAVQVDASQGSTSLTIKSLAMTRQVTWAASKVQALVLSGAHSLVTAAGRTLSTTIDGSLAYTSSGAPATGVWTMAAKKLALKVSVHDGQADVDVDALADGTVERSFTIPVAQLIGRIKP
jgi:hypothetical protein